MTLKQTSGLATRRVNPQCAIVGHGSNHVGYCIVAYRDNIGISIWYKRQQVISSIRAANGIGQFTCMSQLAAVDLSYLTKPSQAMRQTGSHIAGTDDYYLSHLSCKITSKT